MENINIDVDSTVLKNTATQIESVIREMLTASNRIKSQILPQVTESWQGEAKDRFMQSCGATADALESSVRDYRKLVDLLSSSAKDYDFVEDSVKQILLQGGR